MITESVLEVLASRASVELGRVAAYGRRLRSVASGLRVSWQDTWRRHAQV